MNVGALAALLLAVFISALQVVATQHEARRIFMEIEQLKQERDSLSEEWGRLQLELSTWALGDRIEGVAKDSLGMLEPEDGALIYLMP